MLLFSKLKYDFENCPIKENCICSTPNNDANIELYKAENAWRSVLGPKGRAFCISLKLNNASRYNTMVERFHQYGLCRLVTFMRTYRPTKEFIDKYKLKRPGAFACNDAHRTIANVCLTHDNDTALIFEDDALMLNDRFKELPVLVKTLDLLKTKINKNWDCFYLGHFPIWEHPINKNLFRTWSVEAHSYLLSLSGLKKMALTCPQKKQDTNDECVLNYFTQYAFSPHLFVQDNQTDTNIQNSIVESIKKLYTKNRIKTLQNNSLAYDIAIFLFLPLLIIAVVLATVLPLALMTPTKTFTYQYPTNSTFRTRYN